MHVIGIDPGFASVGYAVAEYKNRKRAWSVVGLGVIETKKSDKKRNVRATDDNFERAKAIGRDLRLLVAQYDVRYMAAESMSFPRSASAAGKMCMCWGVMALLAVQEDLPFVCSTPQEIKLRCTGKKSSTKEEVQRAMIEKFNGAHKLGDIVKSKREHPADAVAAIYASLDSDVAKLLMKTVA